MVSEYSNQARLSDLSANLNLIFGFARYERAIDRRTAAFASIFASHCALFDIVIVLSLLLTSRAAGIKRQRYLLRASI